MKREISSVDSFSKWHQQPELDQAEVQIPKLHPDKYHRPFFVPLLWEFSGTSIRNWAIRIWYGTSIQNAGIVHGSLTPSATIPLFYYYFFHSEALKNFLHWSCFRCIAWLLNWSSYKIPCDEWEWRYCMSILSLLPLLYKMYMLLAVCFSLSNTVLDHSIPVHRQCLPSSSIDP